MHILLITNKLGLSHALEVALLDTGYTVTVVSDVCTLDEAISNNLPDVILLGETNQRFFESMRVIQSNLSLAMIPVILYSDDYSVHNTEYQMRLGVKAALSTLLSVPQLLATIQAYSSIVRT